jgi:4-hydroxythreonine-4-phosphate dehydrogenase
MSTKSRISTAKRPEAVIVSLGCPSGVGPELALRAAFRKGALPLLIVGDRGALEAAAPVARVSSRALARLRTVEPSSLRRGSLGEGPWLVEVAPALAPEERAPGRPSHAGGAAQLAYVEHAYALAHRLGLPLVTGPVSKEAIARSGLARARRFLGHTEWLEALDGAPYSVMCFASSRLVTGLVTTHVPLARVSRRLSARLVGIALVELVDLTLRATDRAASRPRIAVCSFNPHAGEGGLLGREEERAILPGIELARAAVGRRAELVGPLGAETAFRCGAAGGFAAVLAMYHDQATIPMKLIDFGGGVNVTQGLSIIRTSVDHGTAYDIAGRGVASPAGLESAIALAARLAVRPRRLALLGP